MSTKPKYDWIVIDTVHGDYWCKRCDTRYTAPTTMGSFDMLMVIMNQFKKEHIRCKAK